MKLNVSCGQHKFVLETDELVSPPASGDATGEGETAAPAEATFVDLRRAIAEEAKIDVNNMKIIHRGKTLSGPDTTPLSEFKFRDNDKLLVMGRAAVFQNDGAFSALVDYEKKHLNGLQGVFDTLGVDLSALEQNFLTGSQRHEALKRMEKRLLQFNETSVRHLESIDGLSLRVDSTSEEQAHRNREKRKALIDGIQDLLNQNDKFLGRLTELRDAIQAEEEEAKK